MNKKKIVSWLLVIIWLLVIFFFSSQNGESSSGLSNGFLAMIENITKLPLNNDAFRFIIRKVAHFTEYLILGVFVLNLINCYRNLTKKEIILGIFFCFIYAVTDEFHQMFVGGRSPQSVDVLIDTTGSIVGSLLFYLFGKRRKIANEKR